MFGIALTPGRNDGNIVNSRMAHVLKLQGISNMIKEAEMIQSFGPQRAGHERKSREQDCLSARFQFMALITWGFGRILSTRPSALPTTIFVRGNPRENGPSGGRYKMPNLSSQRPPPSLLQKVHTMSFNLLSAEMFQSWQEGEPVCARCDGNARTIKFYVDSSLS